MSSRLLQLTQKTLGFSNYQTSRNVIRMLGVAPEEGRSLKKKIAEYNKPDPEVVRRIDIGFPSAHRNDRSTALERSKFLFKIKNDPEMERLARERKLNVSLDDVEREWKESGLASQHIKTVADHYGIFEHLYGYAYFYPRIMLDIEYILENDVGVPVYRGNVVKPREALQAPEVSYRADPDSLWTLIMTNLDGHLSDENSEYVHWFIGNIPGNQVSKGEVIFDYLPPFPPCGTGFHRLVFVLYKQNGKMDYSKLKMTAQCTDLAMRTFKTLDFYAARQDHLTPAGLSFCQTDYDFSVKTIFHEILGMKEPKFEYDFPDYYVRPQVWFPKKFAFNVYMDRFRDPCEINKEYIVDRLKTYDPFCKTKPKLKFPYAQELAMKTIHREKIPTWLRRKKIWDGMGWGRINDSK